MIRKFETEETFCVFYVIYLKSLYFKYCMQFIRTITRTCFFLTGTFWLILLSYGVFCGSGSGMTVTTLRHFFEKYINRLLRLSRGALSAPFCFLCQKPSLWLFHCFKTFDIGSSEWLKPSLWFWSKILSFGDHGSDTIHFKYQLELLGSLRLK